MAGSGGMKRRVSSLVFCRAASKGSGEERERGAELVEDEEKTKAKAGGGDSSSCTVVEVLDDGGFFMLDGVAHATDAGAILVDETTGKTVGYVAYNMKDMDPTELRAVGLPLDSASAESLSAGKKLKLVKEKALRSPRAEDVFGKVLDHLGNVLDGEAGVDVEGDAINEDEVAAVVSSRTGRDECTPVFNDYPGVDDRESISENFYTGVKAIDTIVPVGVGQSMLIMGKGGTQKTRMALDMLLAHKGSDRYKFVYACDRKDLAEVRKTLDEAELAEQSVVVCSSGSAQSKGSRYTALLTALAIAEGVRDGGGEAVVVLDDMASAIHFWEQICETENSYNDEDMNELLEVDGMLIARFDALQRQFFSNILQRSAKMNGNMGGGSLTLFCVLQGEPMREDKMDLGVKILKQQNLAPEMREKLLLALANQVKEKDPSNGEEASAGGSFVSTRTVEEFKSISDGHILMSESNLGRGDDTYDIMPSLSTTRLGVGRVAAPIMMDLCSNLQLMLQQNMDAQAFGNQQEETTNSQSAKSGLVLKLLRQKARNPVALEQLKDELEQVLEKKEAVVNNV